MYQYEAGRFSFHGTEFFCSCPARSGGPRPDRPGLAALDPPYRLVWISGPRHGKQSWSPGSLASLVATYGCPIVKSGNHSLGGGRPVTLNLSARLPCFHLNRRADPIGSMGLKR